MDVVWLEEAVGDLKSVGAYSAEDDPEAAYQVLTRIQTAADSLAHHPEMGRPGRVAKTRELVISGLPYILPYYLKKDEVRILAVMHASRKWPDDFKGKS
ncbi:MAG: type II toxin-antitoxin system RelE/ParE family toxin [Nitrospinaceae bacterium]|nr:type II toxin-antitoxin system RelE/ParE family toxin [Nitrospinaceae bacterium]NIR56910.1 type II toxin-antitoxin system RelE/ParE family toxin [Nitrospinaceae bacterium]NIS87372.1 type II toxin-antitoxin system RelE/ParE family toxin [Nitrospinaceae bacterium]NIT84227.1 type II toxin-antitoxin system RelE/ParE family toxin [Nitrospinaceae bacterium]NIU46412.1 type II toxin-antitoxin system RelE/ParE family toxin [Nitrospinaceae bacterium]